MTKKSRNRRKVIRMMNNALENSVSTYDGNIYFVYLKDKQYYRFHALDFKIENTEAPPADKLVRYY
jgi:hypothetical protein